MASQCPFFNPDQARAHLAAIVEFSEDAIISKTTDGVVLTWNAGAERLYGYSAAEAQGQPMAFLLPPERADEEREILERIRRGERVDHYETIRLRKDDRPIHVSLTISPIRDQNGRLFAIAHTARDISDRKRAEDMLRESEGILRAVLESASQGVLATDRSGRIELVNAKCEEMFGYRREELIGNTLEILLPVRHRDSHVAHRAEYFAWPRPRPMGLGMDLSGRRKDGTEFPVEIALSFVDTREGPLGLAFINDITERKHNEERLRQTQKLESLGLLGWRRRARFQ